MTDQRYRPVERLRTKAEYERVLIRKCSVKGSHLIVHGCENDKGHPRLGRIVSKRWGNAVARNRIRRWLREAYRLSKTTLPPIDLVVMIYQKKGLCYDSIHSELATLARQAHRKLLIKH